MSDSLKKCCLKKSKILFFSMFYIGFFYLKKWAIRSFPHFWWAMWAQGSPKMSNVSKSLRAHQKWAMWANRSCWSPKMSASVRSLTKNEGPWANHSGCSPKMNEWANSSFFLSKSLIRSFFRKKWVIRSENRWANSQPCWKVCWMTLLMTPHILYSSSGLWRVHCAVGWSVEFFFDRTEQGN